MAESLKKIETLNMNSSNINISIRKKKNRKKLNKTVLNDYDDYDTNNKLSKLIKVGGKTTRKKKFKHILSN